MLTDLFAEIMMKMPEVQKKLQRETVRAIVETSCPKCVHGICVWSGAAQRKCKNSPNCIVNITAERALRLVQAMEECDV